MYNLNVKIHDDHAPLKLLVVTDKFNDIGQ